MVKRIARSKTDLQFFVPKVVQENEMLRMGPQNSAPLCAALPSARSSNVCNLIWRISYDPWGRTQTQRTPPPPPLILYSGDTVMMPEPEVPTLEDEDEDLDFDLSYDYSYMM